jgi:F-type H+-transporting ATPase subunit gamma
MLLYDDVDAEVMRCYHEMSLANLIYFALKEGACSEQSSRMTAMDSASKNAGKQQRLEIKRDCWSQLLFFLRR